jgi:septum formation protein
MRLILASSSPRRREILALLGIPFEVIEPEFEERVSPDLAIEDEAIAFARGKAQSVLRRHPSTIVVGSDTMIAVDGQKLGKPADRAHAARMLRLLSGKTHRIFTAVGILDGTGGPGLETVAVVFVEMRPYTEEEIQRYLDCDESMDKAGAYSIQGEGRKLIAAIKGDYLAAVGLPLRPIAEYLKARGFTFRCDVERIYRDKRFLNWQSFDPLG